jgi:CubicO group peptidase (beta-lactamase class C family)
MRKSLMSALYGVYAAEGKIDLNATLGELGIDDKTPLTDVEKTATVKDLLSARSGVYIEAAGEAHSMKATRPARGSHAPGAFWYYNNWDFNALGTIFDQLSGEKNIYTAFDKRIAGPTGMQDYVPEELHYAYEPYSRHPYYGFRLSARDAARFGLLFLRNGRWGDKQVVPADWVRESTAAHSNIGPQSGYGYMWWLGEGEGAFPNVDEGPGSYYASGANGQEIIVMPSRNLVVVHLADSDAGRSVDETSIGTLLWMILDAAGETDIGDPPFLAQAPGTRLTAETLPQALKGCTLTVQAGGVTQEVTGGPDGTLTVSLNGKPLVTGRWWIEGDNLRTEIGGESNCSQVVLNGSELTLFDLDGYATMHAQYRAP